LFKKIKQDLVFRKVENPQTLNNMYSTILHTLFENPTP